MKRLLLLWTLLAALSQGQTLLTPLTLSSAPPCSIHLGVRASRSDLIQFGEVTASLAAQAVRDSSGCSQSASLWVTRKGVSHQIDLEDAANRMFALVDVAPDAAAVLLSTSSSQMAVISLVEEAVRWISMPEMLGLKNCDAEFDPQGFLDIRHVVVALLPPSSQHVRAACSSQTTVYSIDLATRLVRRLDSAYGVKRNAQVVSGMVKSCKRDPDIVAACYVARARLSMAEGGTGMLLWQFGSTHYLEVEAGMVPNELSAKVTPTMRVYGRMVICPLVTKAQSSRGRVCVDSVSEVKDDPVSNKARRGKRR